MTKEISNQRRRMMEIRYTSASASTRAENPLYLALARRGSLELTRRNSFDTSNLDVGTDFSAMNSLQLYDATGETKTSSLIEKGKMIATQSHTKDGKASTTSFFPPFFHGSKDNQYVDYAAEAAMLHDEKVVDLIQSVVEAYAAALKPSAYYISPQKMKQDKHKMNSFVRVALNGDFKVLRS
jgi:hypothetical protein